MITYENTVTDTINAAMTTLNGTDPKVKFHRFTSTIDALPKLLQWANTSNLLVDVYNYDDLWVHGTLTKGPTLHSLLNGRKLIAAPAETA